jgi:hypothetical protein
MVREIEPPARCFRCGGTAFSKDGLQKLPYGTKQRFKCKKCKRIHICYIWVTFDQKAYDKVKKEEFRKYLQYRKDYKKAKEEMGWGGYRIEDL